MERKDQLIRVHKRKKRLKRPLIKHLKVVLGRERIFGDPAPVNLAEADFLARDHPDLVSRLIKHNKYPEVHY